MKEIKGGITSPKGFFAGSTSCGLKKSGKPDLTLLYSECKSKITGVTTQNRFAAAPVLWTQSIIKKGSGWGIIVNSGIANACTGSKGVKLCANMADIASKKFGCNPKDIAVCSTGIIAAQIPLSKISAGLKKITVKDLKQSGTDFAKAIMTTDTVKKECAVQVDINGKVVTIGGCAKGVGMIQPNMATLLTFITTDALIDSATLRTAFKHAVNKSFNRVTVDSDTSTNDTALIFANGKSGCTKILKNSNYTKFSDALLSIMQRLAKMIARDGEGATKLITVKVTGAKSEKDGDTVARSIANSPLVKTAMFGSDPNWGRILMAAGKCGVNFNPSKVMLKLCGVTLVEKGEPKTFNAKSVSKKLSKKDVLIELDLKNGKNEAEIYTCDFSYDYIKINAEYHT